MQFTGDTDDRLGRAGGRIEHLQTGRQERFASVVEFLACIARMLAKRNRHGAAASPGRSATASFGNGA